MSKGPNRRLNRGNIQQEVATHQAAIAAIGLEPLAGLRGTPLLHALKRNQIGVGPYPNVSMFEAANRILSDLVIFTGISGLLADKSFSFDEYRVELGHEDNNGFDIIAESGEVRLVGEAFNVAKSYFNTKKLNALKKLRGAGISADLKLLMYNHDAVGDAYRPKPAPDEIHVMVNTDTGEIQVRRGKV